MKIAEVHTKFSHYKVIDEIYAGRPARVLYGGDRIVAQSGIPRDDDIEPLFDYNQRFREIAQGVKPARLLQLGGGVFTLPSVLMQEDEKLRLDVVEIDGELEAIARQYFGFKPNRRTTVYVGDGSTYFAGTDQTYDMVIIDVFDEAVIPAAFQTEAFMQNLRQHCTARAVVAINVIASLQGFSSHILRIFYALLQKYFPTVQIFPAARDYSLWMSQNYVLVAHDGSWDIATYLLRSPILLPALFR